MKRILSVFAVLLLAFGLSGKVCAEAINDVPDDFWAATEINTVVEKGLMRVGDDNKFAPEQNVSRAQFNSMLLRALGHAPQEVQSEKKFDDVTPSDWAYNDILKSDAIGLIYGYPDNTFRPDVLITKAETASIISHITKDAYSNVEALNIFTDAAEVPVWVKPQYAKTIDMDIYVNYPDKNVLSANKDLNRAEAAVLLCKLDKAFNLIKEEYKAESARKEIEKLRSEHLNAVSGAPNNGVKVASTGILIEGQNVIPVSFSEKFTSRAKRQGNAVVLVVNKDLYTEEGTLAIPQNSKFTGYVDNIVKNKWFNRHAQLELSITGATMADGTQIPASAKVYSNSGVLTPSKKERAIKLGTYAGVGAMGGGGIGVGIASGGDRSYGTSVGIAAPLGGLVGLGVGLVAPGLNYKAKPTDTIYVILNDDLIVGEMPEQEIVDVL